jgi:demethoxyubiquinone hydroxylase (CLK1/Coq7/Cat5 family)
LGCSMSEWIRSPIRYSEIRVRTVPTGNRTAIRRSLRTLHTMEIMAVNVYRFQLSDRHPDLLVPLISAMGNEMTHVQDFQIKLAEFGYRPSLFRWAYWIVGMCIGVCSRVLGRKAILRTASWVESRAIGHYGRILDSTDWDPETRRVLERDRSDENGHLSTWQSLLEIK